jgi:hypothetical protein
MSTVWGRGANVVPAGLGEMTPLTTTSARAPVTSSVAMETDVLSNSKACMTDGGTERLASSVALNCSPALITVGSTMRSM